MYPFCNPLQIEALFNSFDFNEDRKLQLPEFVKLWQRLGEPTELAAKYRSYAGNPDREGNFPDMSPAAFERFLMEEQKLTGSALERAKDGMAQGLFARPPQNATCMSCRTHAPLHSSLGLAPAEVFFLFGTSHWIVTQVGDCHQPRDTGHGLFGNCQQLCCQLG